MNSLNTSSNPKRTPAWAFLLGWWFILMASLDAMFLSFKLLESTYFGNELFSFEPTYLNTGWPLFYFVSLLTFGIYLLYRQYRWKWIILATCILMMLNMVIKYFVLQNGLRYLFTLEDPGLAAFGFPVAHALLFSTLMIWFTFRKQIPEESILALTIIFLIVAGSATIKGPLEILEGHLCIVRSFRVVTWEIFTLGLWKIGLKLLATLLITFSFLLIRKHPNRIRTIAIACWLIGIPLVIHVTEPIWSTLLQFSLSREEKSFLLSIAPYRLEPAILILIPAIITTLLAIRYMDVFREAENSIKGSARCLRCGYNLTGNTSGICPECGTTVLRAAEPGHPKEKPAERTLRKS